MLNKKKFIYNYLVNFVKLCIVRGFVNILVIMDILIILYGYLLYM